MSGYAEMVTAKVCKECKQAIHDKNSIIQCEVKKCVWHKDCLKQKIKGEYEERLDAGYNYAASKSYKTMRCGCGCLLHKKDSAKRIAKKIAKKIIVPIFIVLLIL